MVKAMHASPFILAYGSGEVRVHHDGEAMAVEQEVGSSHQEAERANRKWGLFKTLLLESLYLLQVPEPSKSTQLGTKGSNIKYFCQITTTPKSHTSSSSSPSSPSPPPPPPSSTVE